MNKSLSVIIVFLFLSISVFGQNNSDKNRLQKKQTSHAITLSDKQTPSLFIASNISLDLPSNANFQTNSSHSQRTNFTQKPQPPLFKSVDYNWHLIPNTDVQFGVRIPFPQRGR